MKAGRWDRIAVSILALALAVAVGCGKEDAGTTPKSGDGSTAGTGGTPDAGTPSMPDATAGLKVSAPSGSGTTYWFGANPTKTNITFATRTSLGSMSGSTNQIAGWANIDDKGKTGGVHLVVPAISLNTALAGRDSRMKSDQYLDVEKFATIEFKAEKASTQDGSTWTIPGKFTLHGVTKDLTVQAGVTKIPDEISQKSQFGKGSWVNVLVEFDVLMSDYGLEVPKKYANVDDKWSIKIDLFGTTEKPAQPIVAKAIEEVLYIKPDKVTVDDKFGQRHRFGLKPQMSNISVVSKTDIETVVIQTVSLGGEVAIDEEKKTGKVSLIVPVASLKSGIDKRDKKLLGPDWLDAANHKNILFESTSATMKDEDTWTVEGEFEIRGKKSKVKTDVDFAVVDAKTARTNGWGLKPGLTFHATFKLKLSDFGIKIPDITVGRVSDELTITFDATAIRK